jgi:hypothetical protein
MMTKCHRHFFPHVSSASFVLTHDQDSRHVVSLFLAKAEQCNQILVYGVSFVLQCEEVTTVLSKLK